ncbi:MAG: hypothetical protein ACLSEU_08010 [Streptococcus salivarius]
MRDTIAIIVDLIEHVLIKVSVKQENTEDRNDLTKKTRLYFENPASPARLEDYTIKRLCEYTPVFLPYSWVQEAEI